MYLIFILIWIYWVYLIIIIDSNDDFLGNLMFKGFGILMIILFVFIYNERFIFLFKLIS